MNSGTHFNRKDIYDNMWDFLRDLNNINDDIYVNILDLTTTHFEENDKALAYPMMWALIKKYAKEHNKIKLDIAIRTWFENQKT